MGHTLCSWMMVILGVLLPITVFRLSYCDSPPLSWSHACLTALNILVAATKLGRKNIFLLRGKTT